MVNWRNPDEVKAWYIGMVENGEIIDEIETNEGTYIEVYEYDGYKVYDELTDEGDGRTKVKVFKGNDVVAEFEVEWVDGDVRVFL